MKLSVIIPVYRVEATLDRCVESIVRQTFGDLEVILVDDGSPDHCPQMCDDWARRDGRIKVVHKPNGGLSDARNAGLDIAKGDYLTFADSDDCLDLSTYQHAMSAMAESHDGAMADIVEFPVYRHYGAPWQKLLSFGSCVFTSAADYWLRGKAYEHSYAWNKIYARRLFDNVRFPVGRVFEDVATLQLLLEHVHCVVTIGQGLYYYYANQQGITATAQGPQLQMLLEEHIKAMGKWCDDSYYMHVLNIQSDVCEQTHQPPVLPLRTVSPLADGLTASQRIKALALRVVGMEGTCKLNKALHRWKKPTR